jgi:hypothetical protein
MTRRSYKEFAQPCPFAAAPPLRPPGPPGSAPDDAFRAGQIGRTAGSFDAAPHARCADTSAHPDHQRLAAHLAELGIVAAQGTAGVNELRAIVADERDTRLPIDARASVIVLAAQIEALESVIGAIEKQIKMQHRSNEASQRVETIPGIGIIGATAMVADPTIFRSGATSSARPSSSTARYP